MTKNLKKRISTSFVLFLILFLAFINNYVLGYVLMIAAIFSTLEFFGITKILFKKHKLKKIFLNSIFIFYIFYFSAAFLTLSFSLFLKILISLGKMSTRVCKTENYKMFPSAKVQIIILVGVII